jgi:cation:H+ antiporter
VLTAFGLVLLALVVLALGGELLVRGAVGIARVAGLTPAVIGLTVVALGTSLPELVVSVIASLKGQPDLSIGNVIGSNIINLSFILGLAALVRPLAITGNVVRVEWPIMFVASAAFVGWSWDGRLSRVESTLFLVLLVLVMVNAIRLARREVSEGESAQLGEEVAALAPKGVLAETSVAAALTALGIGLLIVGGRWLVEGAVGLAELAGMSERVIGLTIVAGGTSAPEIATSVVAAVRGRSDIAVANLIGSNIFNVLGILGVAGVITPITVSPAMLGSDVWWMLGIELLLFLLMWLRRRLSRLDGAILLGAYLTYLGFLLGVRI